MSGTPAKKGKKNSTLFWLPKPRLETDFALIDQMEGHQFEHWCAELLRKLGYQDVYVTQGSGDQGVDIVAVNNGVRYAFQCKRYSKGLGNTPVQEVYAGMAMYNCSVGVVITNQGFTQGAVDLAKKTGVVLIDRSGLNDMIREVNRIEGPLKDNVTIIRRNKRPQGEAKTSTYIDGKKMDTDLDQYILLSLSEGKHTVYFQRAFIKSKEIEFTISADNDYQINVTPKIFSIDVDIKDVPQAVALRREPFVIQEVRSSITISHLIAIGGLVASILLVAFLPHFNGIDRQTNKNSPETATTAKEITYYADAESFEAALNNGEDLEGKVVKFVADELHPNSAYGYNIWAGEHLNFTSPENPDVQVGDVITARIIAVKNVLGSWIITYEKIDSDITDETLTVVQDELMDFLGTHGDVSIAVTDLYDNGALYISLIAEGMVSQTAFPDYANALAVKSQELATEYNFYISTVAVFFKGNKGQIMLWQTDNCISGVLSDSYSDTNLLLDNQTIEDLVDRYGATNWFYHLK